MTTPLWKHQIEMLKWLKQRVEFNHGHAALFAEMRTGKTRVAVEFVRQHGFRVVLILCPKKTNLVWRSHFETFAPEYSILDLTSGRLPDRARLIKHVQDQPTAVIMNYDALNSSAVLAAVYARLWDCVVADEAHRLKAPTGKRSKAAAKIRARFKLALTGTPFHNRPLDVFGIHRFLSNVNGYKSTLFGTWTAFKYHYARWYGPNSYILGGYINQDELAAKIDTFAYQVKSKDVLELPEQLHINYPVELEADVYRYYKKLERDNIVKIQSGVITTKNALVNLLRLQQMIGGYAVFNDGQRSPVSAAKAEALAVVIEDVGVQPIVVFYRFTSDMEMILNVLGKDKQVYFLNGYGDLLQEWNASENGILLVQIGAGAEGVDLSKSRYFIYYSKDFSLGTYQQSLARGLKHGKDESVTYIHLYVPNTVDEDIHQLLTQKETSVQALEQKILSRYVV